MANGSARVEAVHITARNNPTVVRANRVASDGAFARREGLCWIDGDHLLRAALDQGMVPVQCFITEDAWEDDALRALAQRAARVAIVPATIMRQLAALDTPTKVAALLAVPQPRALDPRAPTVVLDRVQDPGNVGTILRSASAFGFAQVLALKGTASVWSAKVIRAAMGAHFALNLIEGSAALVEQLRVPCLGTSSHAQETLGAGSTLPFPCAWVFGHEGGGLDATLQALCTRMLRIPQPGGHESLNVAMAASICLYESRRGVP